MRINVSSKPYRHSGFTLIELVVTLLILAVGMVAIARFQSTLMVSSGQAKARTEALSLAEQRLEDMRYLRHVTHYQTRLTTGQSINRGINAIFTCHWRVTSNQQPAYKTIEVKVRWQDKEGPQSVILTSIIAAHDPGHAGQLLAGTI